MARLGAVHTPQGEIQNPFKDPGELADEAINLHTAALQALDQWAERTAAHPQGPEWRKQGATLLAEKRAGAIAHYAFASLLAALGEDDEATRQFVVLCERLSQVSAWAAVGEIAERALGRGAGAPAARWLVRAADATGGSEESFEALERAHEAAPGEPRIAWRLAQELEARGEQNAAVRTTARTLEAMARKRDTEALDDVLLHLLEKPDARTMQLVFEPLRTFAKSGETERVADFLEMAWPTIIELELASECWQVLRRMVVEVGEPAPLLRLLPAAAETGLAEGAEARRLLGLSGINSGTEPGEALELFERLLPFAVGAYAEHQNWGAGRVTEVSPEEVWLDFPNKPGHRMTLRAAHQALTPVAADDLAVLGSRDPAELERLRNEDPVELVARTLKRLQREATTTELKRGVPKALSVGGSAAQSRWRRPRRLRASRLRPPRRRPKSTRHSQAIPDPAPRIGRQAGGTPGQCSARLGGRCIPPLAGETPGTDGAGRRRRSGGSRSCPVGGRRRVCWEVRHQGVDCGGGSIARARVGPAIGSLAGCGAFRAGIAFCRGSATRLRRLP
jgi:hypothetical protein